MSGRKRLFFLISTMATVSLVVALIAIYILYNAAFAEEQARPVETAMSQARLMEAVERFNAVYMGEDQPESWTAATLSQIRDLARLENSPWHDATGIRSSFFKATDISTWKTPSLFPSKGHGPNRCD